MSAMLSISDDPREYSELYRLLRVSFPPEELRLEKDFLALRENDVFSAYVFRREGVIAGFFGVWLFDDFRFVEYFAVRPELRGAGIGGAMLRELSEMAPTLPICLEAELPESSDIATRRIEFYRRGGYIVNPFYYLQPPYTDSMNPIEMKLLSSPKPIREAEFARRREIIYRVVYKTDTDTVSCLCV